MAALPLWKKADSRGAGKGATAGEREKAATAGEREKAATAGEREKATTAGEREKATTAGERAVRRTFSSLMVSDERSMSSWRSRMKLSTSAGVRERP